MSAPSRFPAILDRAAFTGLAGTMPSAELRDLVELFVAETEFYMAEIAARRAQGDLESVARLARNIVSVAGSLGAARASALARQLERTCRAGDKTGSYRLISDISQACRDAGEEMNILLRDEKENFRTAQA